MPAGRPTVYNPDLNKQVTKICRLGATDPEIADFLEIDPSTVSKWKNDFPEFSEAIKKGKIMADAEVANKLYKRATGYQHEDVDIKMFEGQIIKTPLVKHYPPDTAAAIFWLKNRQSAKWRDKQDTDLNITGLEVIRPKSPKERIQGEDDV